MLYGCMRREYPFDIGWEQSETLECGSGKGMMSAWHIPGTTTLERRGYCGNTYKHPKIRHAARKRIALRFPMD